MQNILRFQISVALSWWIEDLIDVLWLIFHWKMFGISGIFCWFLEKAHMALEKSSQIS